MADNESSAELLREASELTRRANHLGCGLLADFFLSEAALLREQASTVSALDLVDPASGHTDDRRAKEVADDTGPVTLACEPEAAKAVIIHALEFAHAAGRGRRVTVRDDRGVLRFSVNVRSEEAAGLDANDALRAVLERRSVGVDRPARVG